MLSLISTLGGLLISGLPKLLDYFQNKADQKHELALAKIQTERVAVGGSRLCCTAED